MQRLSIACGITSVLLLAIGGIITVKSGFEEAQEGLVKTVEVAEEQDQDGHPSAPVDSRGWWARARDWRRAKVSPELDLAFFQLR